MESHRRTGDTLIETAQIQDIRRRLAQDMLGILTPGRANGYPASVFNKWFDGNDKILPVTAIADSQRNSDTTLMPRFCNQMIWTRPIWVDEMSYSLRRSALGARRFHREDHEPRVDLVASSKGFDRGVDVLSGDFVLVTINDALMVSPLDPEVAVTLDWVDDLNHLLPILVNRLGLPAL